MGLGQVCRRKGESNGHLGCVTVRAMGKGSGAMEQVKGLFID